MKAVIYLTFAGNCAEAIELYKTAFNTTTDQVMKFGDMPPSENFPVPAEYADKVLQATLKTSNGGYIRMSDCGPGHALNTAETEQVAIAIEDISVDAVKHAFETLAKEGRVGIPLNQTFFSECFGVVFDKFGVMWNISAPAAAH